MYNKEIEVCGEIFEYKIDWLPKTKEYMCTVNCDKVRPFYRSEEITPEDVYTKIRQAVFLKMEPISEKEA